MKKVLIASFLAIIMLMVPITTAAQTANVSYINNISKTPKLYSANLSSPKLYITEAQRYSLNLYIESKFEGEDKTQAYEIVNDVIGYDYEVDPVKLAEAWEEYGYQPIPQEEIDNAATADALEALITAYWLLNVFAELVLFVTSLIESRLGWLFYFINEGLSLFVEGVGLVIDFLYITLNLLKAFVSAVNQILTVPEVFAEAIASLFNQEFGNFLYTIGYFMGGFAITFVDIISGLILLLVEFARIVNYLGEILTFFIWLNNKPWMDPILVRGVVKENIFFPIVGAEVTCKGETTTTNENGEFSFYVGPSPDETSFPPNEYYGMHQCIITVSKDGEVLKQSTELLSYAFSGGTIYWPFIIIRDRPKDTSFGFNLMGRFSNFIERIRMLAPNIVRSFNRIDILSI